MSMHSPCKSVLNMAFATYLRYMVQWQYLYPCLVKHSTIVYHIDWTYLLLGMRSWMLIAYQFEILIGWLNVCICSLLRESSPLCMNTC